MTAFPSTFWALVKNASKGSTRSVSDLVERYRPAIVRFARTRGLDASEAEDVAQEVFLRVFEGHVLERADRAKGRFRSLLLAVTRNVLGHHFARKGRAKRGGGRRIVSLDEFDGVALDECLARDERDAEFDRLWLGMLLAESLRRLERENAGYYRCLHASVEGKTHEEIALELGKTEAAVRNSISRGRSKLAATLREEIAAYASSGEELDAEMRYLSTFLGKSAGT